MLEQTTPQARAAQIPLQTFNLPIFPAESFTSSPEHGGIESLILTSDITMSEYQSLLAQPFSMPALLPPTITSLALELFALGFPPGFLAALGAKLPRLRAVTVYHGMVAGITSASREDAVAFFGAAREALSEAHLLDVFAPEGFFAEVAESLMGVVGGASKVEGGGHLKLVEISYTFRHSDPRFLDTLPRGAELARFVRGGLVGLRLGIVGPGVVVEGDDGAVEGTEIGVLVKGREEGEEVVGAIVKRGGGLGMCDLTMFELGGEQIARVLSACKGLTVGAFSVTVEKGWEEVLAALAAMEDGVGMEYLELVGVPGMEMVEGLKEGKEIGVRVGELLRLGEKWRELRSVRVSLCRTKGEEWVREGEEWVKR